LDTFITFLGLKFCRIYNLSASQFWSPSISTCQTLMQVDISRFTHHYQ
jgi:hypothetical protein